VGVRDSWPLRIGWRRDEDLCSLGLTAVACVAFALFQEDGDFLGLLAVGEKREGGRDNRESGERRGGNGRDLARQVR
jgi:hypothetical protein